MKPRVISRHERLGVQLVVVEGHPGGLNTLDNWPADSNPQEGFIGDKLARGQYDLQIRQGRAAYVSWHDSPCRSLMYARDCTFLDTTNELGDIAL